MKVKQLAAFSLGGFILAAIGAYILVAVVDLGCHDLSFSRAELKKLTQKAEWGDGQACWCLYLYYLRGNQAATWAEKAANYGDPQGQYHMYERLKDIDPKRALELLRKSAAQDHVRALMEIGMLYRGSQLGQRDLREAERYLRRAADKGDDSAMSELSMVLVEKYESKAKLIEAYKWVLIAESRNRLKTGFAQKLELQKEEITSKASQLKYRATSLLREAESQAIREDKLIPHIPLAPDYGSICNKLLE